MKKRITTAIIVDRFRNLHGDRFDYSLVDYRDLGLPVKIICPVHGVFEQTPTNHMHSASKMMGDVRGGCRQCSIEARAKLDTLPWENVLETFIQAHGDKYDYSNVVYVQNRIPIRNIRCRTHNIVFDQMLENHRRGNGGCPECALAARVRKKTTTQEQYISRAKQAHGDRYDYSLTVFKHSTQKVTIVCPIHGPWDQEAHSHIRGCGCPECAVEARAGQIRVDWDTMLARFATIHGNRYDYSEAVFSGVTKSIIIGCDIHGKFEQNAYAHGSGSGCPECGKLTTADKIRNDLAEVIGRCIARHGDRYDYSRITDYSTRHDIVEIGCSMHGWFSQRINHHWDGGNCPRCALLESSSAISQRWLDECGIPIDMREYPIVVPGNSKTFHVDGFDPTSNMAYEFHGDYYHGNPALYDALAKNKKWDIQFGELHQRTVKRRNKILSTGVTIVEMWESDYEAGRPPIIHYPPG